MSAHCSKIVLLLKNIHKIINLSYVLRKQCIMMATKPKLSEYDVLQNIVYINLDRRTDRRDEIEHELNHFGLLENATRISAIDKGTFGAIGCTMSHLKALETAKSNGWNHVVVLEDDFCWRDDTTPKSLGSLLKTFEDEADTIALKWDVLFLSCRPYSVHSIEGCSVGKRVTRALTSSGYIVSARYYDALIQNFSESIALLLMHGSMSVPQYALDVHWASLQNKDTWIVLEPIVGKQRPGYSDIARKHVQYTC